MGVVIHYTNFNTVNYLSQISLISNKFWIGLQSKVDFPTRDSSVDPEL
jgi:hypothetical protein